MESNTFDRLVSRMGTDASRRRVLGGLLGVATAALAGGTALEAKPRQRRPSRKVAICHVTSRGRVERLRVGGRALRAHLAHGDFRFRDCCVNADCEVGACFAAQCVAGTCSVTQLPQGTPCDLEGPVGGIGGCTPAGNCVPAGGGGGGG
jgi:hypothetical protein